MLFKCLFHHFIQLLLTLKLSNQSVFKPQLKEINKMDNKEVQGYELVTSLLSNKLLKVDRREFLYHLFKENDQIDTILEKGPTDIIDEQYIIRIAQKLINDTTLKSSAASFIAGIPGGPAAFATIPADILQFYGMSINLAQKLMYLYGYPDMYNDDNLTEDGKNALIVFLGVMLGVSGASTAVKGISSDLAGQAIKKLPQKALTKTVYYPIVKKTLATLGVKVTKNSFARSVSKVIPVVGGAVSGGLTLVTLKPMGNKLQTTLHEGTFIKETENIIIVEAEAVVVEEESSYDKLIEAKKLFDLGIVYEDEFNLIKEKYLNKF